MAFDPKSMAELEALEALVTSDGWGRLCAHAGKAWGNAAFATRLDAALPSHPDDMHRISANVAALAYQRRAVDELLQWPMVRLENLRSQRAQAQEQAAADPREKYARPR